MFSNNIWIFQHPWLVVNLACSIPLMLQVGLFSLILFLFLRQFFNVLSNFVSPTVKITSVEERQLNEMDFPLLFKVV